MKKIDFEFIKICLIPFLLAIIWCSQVFGQTVLVDEGAVWKYLDDGSNQDTLWQDPGFDDTAWASGPAQLGYGDGDEATVISFGPNSSDKYRTYYFRHTFNVTNPSQYLSIILGLLRDDGAIVYLNGVELERSNMPAGTINYLTFAASTVAGSDEDTFFESFEDPANLINGTNVLAVEVHQRNATSSDVSFDLSLIGSMTLPDLTRKAPYLIYNGNADEMQVLWQLTSTVICTIDWGLDTLYSVGSAQTNEYGNDYQHSYTITNLAADTKYYYRVTVNQEIHKGLFRSAPDPNVTTLKFFAYGDTRTYPASHNQVAAGIINTFTEDEDFQTFIISVGDLVNDGDMESDWDSQFFDPSYPNIQKMLASLPYQACMGNHEGAGILFQKYFPYPFEAGRYWSFDYGPVHMVVVDQYTSYSPGSAQLTWIENDLASTNKPWKFIYLHEPGWSAGGHGNETAVQNYIQPLCEQYGVPIVFAGHNHYYARAVVNKVHHITTGGGGAPLYAPIPTYPNLVSTSQSLHFCKIEIDSNLLILTVENPTGTVIDSFAVDNHTSYANEVTLSHTYLQPGVDNLIINAPLINNGGHNVELKAMFISTDSSYQDSLLLYDDGLHNDGAAGDGIYGNLMFAPGSENEVMVGLKTFDLDYNTTITFDDLGRFTTVGPVIYNGYSINQTVNQILFTEITLLNSSATTTVTDIRAIISSNDPKITNIGNNNQIFGDIGPGQTGTSQSNYSIFTTNLQPTDTLSFNVEVYSDGRLFWNDSTASMVVGIPSDNQSIPTEYSLKQNYPNPFNPSTTIKFDLQKTTNVTLKIFNILGEEVATLVSDRLSTGSYSYEWDASNLASGVYLYRLQAGDYVETRKMVLME